MNKPLTIGDATFYLGDCLEVMDKLESESINLIFCDLPYGITACKWDIPIDLELLWKHYKRLIKPTGTVLLTGTQPFTSKLILSNPKWFKYEYIWKKSIASNFANAKKQPMRLHENVCVFYKKSPTYNPIMKDGQPYRDYRRARSHKIILGEEVGGSRLGQKRDIFNKGSRYPSTIIKVKNPNAKNIHPTQKPVHLLTHLIRTHSNKGGIVLDNCFGSGATAVACNLTDRVFIGIEKEKKYFNLAVARYRAETKQMRICDLKGEK